MTSASIKKAVAASLAGVHLLAGGVFIHAAESNLWADRRKTVASRGAAVQTAALPAAGGLAGDLPSVTRTALSPALLAGAAALPPSLDLLKHIPQRFGSVRGVFFPAKAPARSPVVILVQDVHLNPEAQAHIGGLVAALAEAGRAGLVALEGAFGPADLSRFRAFPDAAARRMAADHLLREGRLSGAAHALLTSPVAVPAVVGVDDRARYDANVAAYRASAPRQAALRERLAAAADALAREKRAVFSPALLAFDAELASFRRGGAGMGEHLRRLARRAPATPEVARFLRALDMEAALDFQRVEAERARVIDALLSRLARPEIDALLRTTASYRAGQVGHALYYERLRDLCRRHGVGPERAPAFDAYVRYLLAADAIRPEALFAEAAALEKAAFAALVRTPAERRLVDRSRRLWLLGKLVDFSLSPEEWAELRERGQTDGFDVSSFTAFYENAQARDQAMAENFLKALGAAPVALLVAGGYHAPGLTDRLTRAGCTVVSFVPRLTRLDPEAGADYLGAFTREKTPLDRMFQGRKLFVTPDPWAGAADLPGLHTGLANRATDLPAAQDQALYDAQLPSGARGTVRVRAERLPGGDVLVEESSRQGRVERRLDVDGETLRAVDVRAPFSLRAWALARLPGRTAEAAPPPAEVRSHRFPRVIRGRESAPVFMRHLREGAGLSETDALRVLEEGLFWMEDGSLRRREAKVQEAMAAGLSELLGRPVSAGEMETAITAHERVHERIAREDLEQVRAQILHAFGPQETEEWLARFSRLYGYPVRGPAPAAPDWARWEEVVAHAQHERLLGNPLRGMTDDGTVVAFPPAALKIIFKETRALLAELLPAEPALVSLARGFFDVRERLRTAFLRADRAAYGEAHRALLLLQDRIQPLWEGRNPDRLIRATLALAEDPAYAGLVDNPTEVLFASGRAFSEEQREAVARDAEELARALSRTPEETEQVAAGIRARTKPFRLSSVIPSALPESPIPEEHRARLAALFDCAGDVDTLQVMAMVHQDVTSGEVSVIVRSDFDELGDFHASAKHENVHRLQALGLLPLSADNEVATTATSALESMRGLGPDGFRRRGSGFEWAVFERGRRHWEEGGSLEDLDALARLAIEAQRAHADTLPTEREEEDARRERAFDRQKGTTNIDQVYALQRALGNLTAGFLYERQLRRQMDANPALAASARPWAEADYDAVYADLFDHVRRVVSVWMPRQPSSDERSRVERIVSQATAMVRAVMGRPNMELAPWSPLFPGDAPQWRFLHDERGAPLDVFQFVPGDLVRLDETSIQGRVWQEIFRATHSDPALLAGAEKDDRLFSTLWHALETSRVLEAGRARWGGGARAADRYHKDRAHAALSAPGARNAFSTLPPPIQFLEAAFSEGLAAAPDARPVAPQVRQALDDTAEARRRYKRASSGRDALRLLRAEIWPRVEGLRRLSPEESPDPTTLERMAQSFAQREGLPRRPGAHAGAPSTESGDLPSPGHEARAGGALSSDADFEAMAHEAEEAARQAASLSDRAREVAERAAAAHDAAQTTQGQAAQVRDESGAAPQDALAGPAGQAAEESRALRAAAGRTAEAARRFDALARRLRRKAESLRRKDGAPARDLSDRAEELGGRGADLVRRAERFKDDAGALAQSAESLHKKIRERPGKTEDIREEARGLEQQAKDLSRQAEEIQEEARAAGRTAGLAQKDAEAAARGAPAPREANGTSGATTSPAEEPSPAEASPAAEAVRPLTRAELDRQWRTADRKVQEARLRRMGITAEQHALYLRYFNPVRRFVNMLHGKLWAILEFSKEKKVLGGLEEGDEFDEDGGLVRAARGRRDVRQEDLLPGKLNYKVSLLMDVSGSMVASRLLDDAVKAGLLLAASLGKFPADEVDFEEYAFSDQAAIPLKAFGEPYNMKKAVRIVDGLVNGKHGDTRGVEALSEAVGRHRAADPGGKARKIIIVVSDGEFWSVRLEDGTVLTGRQAVQRLISENPDIRIIGLGIGPAARKVAETFGGNGLVVEDISKLPQELARVLSRELKRGAQRPPAPASKKTSLFTTLPNQAEASRSGLAQAMSPWAAPLYGWLARNAGPKTAAAAAGVVESGVAVLLGRLLQFGPLLHAAFFAAIHLGGDLTRWEGGRSPGVSAIGRLLGTSRVRPPPRLVSAGRATVLQLLGLAALGAVFHHALPALAAALVQAHVPLLQPLLHFAVLGVDGLTLISAMGGHVLYNLFTPVLLAMIALPFAAPNDLLTPGSPGWNRLTDPEELYKTVTQGLRGRAYRGPPGAARVPGDDVAEMIPLPSNLKVLRDMEEVSRLPRNRNISLVGDMGDGKNLIALMFARMRNQGARVISCHERMTERDLWEREKTVINADGSMSSVWVPSEFAEAMENGEIAVFDEFNKMPAGVRAALNRALQGRQAQMPSTGRSVDFRGNDALVITLTNQPGGIYKTKPTSAEQLDRFQTIGVEYLPDDEELALLRHVAPGVPADIFKQVIQVAGRVREDHRSADALMPWPVSTRALVKLARHLQAFPDDQKRVPQVFAKVYWIPDDQPEARRLLADLFGGTQLPNEAPSDPLVLDVVTKRAGKVERRFLRIARKRAGGALWDLVEAPLRGGASSGRVPSTVLQAHEMTPTNLKRLHALMKDLVLGENILLVGDMGTGKDWAMDVLANALEAPLPTMSINETTRPRHFLQREVLDRGRSDFEDSENVKAMRNGWLIRWDEVDRGEPSSMAAANNILAYKFVTLPNGDVLYAAPGFGVVANMNPPRPPYLGQALSGEFLDRFNKHEVDYLPHAEEAGMLAGSVPAVPRAVIDKLVKAAERLRLKFREGEGLPHPPSRRTLEKVIDRLAVAPGHYKSAFVEEGPEGAKRKRWTQGVPALFRQAYGNDGVEREVGEGAWEVIERELVVEQGLDNIERFRPIDSGDAGFDARAAAVQAAVNRTDEAAAGAAARALAEELHRRRRERIALPSDAADTVAALSGQAAALPEAVHALKWAARLARPDEAVVTADGSLDALLSRILHDEKEEAAVLAALLSAVQNPGSAGDSLDQFLRQEADGAPAARRAAEALLDLVWEGWDGLSAPERIDRVFLLKELHRRAGPALRERIEAGLTAPEGPGWHASVLSNTDGREDFLARARPALESAPAARPRGMTQKRIAEKLNASGGWTESDRRLKFKWAAPDPARDELSAVILEEGKGFSIVLSRIIDNFSMSVVGGEGKGDLFFSTSYTSFSIPVRENPVLGIDVADDFASVAFEVPAEVLEEIKRETDAPYISTHRTVTPSGDVALRMHREASRPFSVVFRAPASSPPPTLPGKAAPLAPIDPALQDLLVKLAFFSDLRAPGGEGLHPYLDAALRSLRDRLKGSGESALSAGLASLEALAASLAARAPALSDALGEIVADIHERRGSSTFLDEARARFRAAVAALRARPRAQPPSPRKGGAAPPALLPPFDKVVQGPPEVLLADGQEVEVGGRPRTVRYLQSTPFALSGGRVAVFVDGEWWIRNPHGTFDMLLEKGAKVKGGTGEELSIHHTDSEYRRLADGRYALSFWDSDMSVHWVAVDDGGRVEPLPEDFFDITVDGRLIRPHFVGDEVEGLDGRPVRRITEPAGEYWAVRVSDGVYEQLPHFYIRMGGELEKVSGFMKGARLPDGRWSGFFRRDDGRRNWMWVARKEDKTYKLLLGEWSQIWLENRPTTLTAGSVVDAVPLPNGIVLVRFRDNYDGSHVVYRLPSGEYRSVRSWWGPAPVSDRILEISLLPDGRLGMNLLGHSSGYKWVAFSLTPAAAPPSAAESPDDLLLRTARVLEEAGGDGSIGLLSEAYAALAARGRMSVSGLREKVKSGGPSSSAALTVLGGMASALSPSDAAWTARRLLGVDEDWRMAAQAETGIWSRDWGAAESAGTALKSLLPGLDREDLARAVQALLRLTLKASGDAPFYWTSLSERTFPGLLGSLLPLLGAEHRSQAIRALSGADGKSGLRAGDASIRGAAVMALRALGPSMAQAELLEAAQALLGVDRRWRGTAKTKTGLRDEEIRRHAGKALAVLVKHMESPAIDPLTRRMMGVDEEGEATDETRTGLRDGSEGDSRETAATVLGALGPASSAEVRARAVRALLGVDESWRGEGSSGKETAPGQWAVAEALGSLIPSLDEQDRRSAVRALLDNAGTGLQDRSPGVRLTLLPALGTLWPSFTVDERRRLLRALTPPPGTRTGLRDEDPKVRKASADLLGALAVKDGWDVADRARAAQALMGLDAHWTPTEGARTGLRDPENDVRWAAGKAFGALGSSLTAGERASAAKELVRLDGRWQVVVRGTGLQEVDLIVPDEAGPVVAALGGSLPPPDRPRLAQALLGVDESWEPVDQARPKRPNVPLLVALAPALRQEDLARAAGVLLRHVMTGPSQGESHVKEFSMEILAALGPSLAGGQRRQAVQALLGVDADWKAADGTKTGLRDANADLYGPAAKALGALVPALEKGSRTRAIQFLLGVDEKWTPAQETRTGVRGDPAWARRFPASALEAISPSVDEEDLERIAWVVAEGLKPGGDWAMLRKEGAGILERSARSLDADGLSLAARALLGLDEDWAARQGPKTGVWSEDYEVRSASVRALAKVLSSPPSQALPLQRAAETIADAVRWAPGVSSAAAAMDVLADMAGGAKGVAARAASGELHSLLVDGPLSGGALADALDAAASLLQTHFASAAVSDPGAPQVARTAGHAVFRSRRTRIPEGSLIAGFGRVTSRDHVEIYSRKLRRVWAVLGLEGPHGERRSLLTLPTGKPKTPDGEFSGAELVLGENDRLDGIGSVGYIHTYFLVSEDRLWVSLKHTGPFARVVVSMPLKDGNVVRDAGAAVQGARVEIWGGQRIPGGTVANEYISLEVKDGRVGATVTVKESGKEVFVPFGEDPGQQASRRGQRGFTAVFGAAWLAAGALLWIVAPAWAGRGAPPMAAAAWLGAVVPFGFSAYLALRGLPEGFIAATARGLTTPGLAYFDLGLAARLFVNFEEMWHRATTRAFPFLASGAGWARPFRWLDEAGAKAFGLIGGLALLPSALDRRAPLGEADVIKGLLSGRVPTYDLNSLDSRLVFLEKVGRDLEAGRLSAAALRGGLGGRGTKAQALEVLHRFIMGGARTAAPLARTLASAGAADGRKAALRVVIVDGQVGDLDAFVAAQLALARPGEGRPAAQLRFLAADGALAARIEALTRGRPEARVLSAGAAFASGAFSLAEAERLLSADVGACPESTHAWQVVAPEGLAMDFGGLGADSVFRRALYIFLKSLLEAVSIAPARLEGMDAVARAIASAA